MLDIPHLFLLLEVYMCTHYNLELYLYLSLFFLRNFQSSGILCMGLLQSHNEVK